MAVTRITQGAVDKLQENLTLRRAGGSEFLARAETEYAWATDTDAYELEPGLERSQLLSAAADDFIDGGEPERALEVAREAVAAAAPGTWHAHVALIDAHLALGELDAAKAVADEVRKGAGSDPAIAQIVGEAFELADEPALAERWYTIGLRGADRGEDDYWHLLLLRDRHRVRRDQLKPLDGMDAEFESLSAE